MTALAPTLKAFFVTRLVNEKGVSPHTIAAYRDTFRMLLAFAQKRTGKQPCKLEIEDLDAPLITAFLDHLEHDRGNSPRTRAGGDRTAVRARPRGAGDRASVGSLTVDGLPRAAA
jgi:integrase/recombinase XerD